MKTATATNGKCRNCGVGLPENHTILFGRSCHRCRLASSLAASVRDYYERLLAAGDPDALEDAVGVLELVLVRHGVATR